MEVLCFHELAQVAQWRADFDRLSLASRRQDPFSTLGFIENFAAHPQWYPGDKDGRLWFLVAIEGDTPVGYLALRRIVSRVLGRPAAKLVFFVTHDNDCPGLVAPPEREAEVAVAMYRYLLGRKDEWSLLEFHQQLDGSPLTPPPGEVDLSACYVRTWPTKENNTVAIQWPSIDSYLKALGARYRGEVRRKARKLLAAGQLSWLSSNDPAATPLLLELVRLVEAKSWKSEHEIALDHHPDRVAYFQGLLAPGQPMRIRISVLMLGSLPVCASICGEYGRTLYGLVTIFDDRAAELSPGAAMQVMKVRLAIVGGYRALNLLSGYAYYKSRWLAGEHPTRSGQVFRLGTPYFWKAILGEFKRRVTPPAPARPLDFNPDRRNASGAGAGALLASQAERARIESVLAQLAGLRVERLGHAELAAALLGEAAPALASHPTDERPQRRAGGT